MNQRQPPRLATWLLGRLLAGNIADALIGDLHERYAAGASRRWFWGQTCIAIMESARKGLWDLARALGASLVTAWALLIVCQFSLPPIGAQVMRALQWLGPIRYGEEPALAKVLWWLHWVGLIFIIHFAAGWIAIRLSRGYRRTLIAMMVASAVGAGLPVIGRLAQRTAAFASTTGHPSWHWNFLAIFIDVSDGALLLQRLVWALLSCGVAVAGVLAGSATARRRASLAMT
jgi:hypothetical protein